MKEIPCLEVVILGAARTPVGRYLDSLTDIPAWKLGSIAIAEAIKRAGVTGPNRRSHHGQRPHGRSGTEPARQRRWPRACHYHPRLDPQSRVRIGHESVHEAARAINAGDAEMMVAGGMENMSAAPYLVPARLGYRMGDGVSGRDSWAACGAP